MKRVLSLSIVVILILATLAGVSAVRQSSDVTAAEPDPDEQISSSLDSPTAMAQTADEIANYWTADRMRNAQPLDVANRSGEPKKAKNASGPQGEPGGVEPSNGSLYTGDISETIGNEIIPSSADAASYSYPYPFTRLNVFTSYTHQKYRTTGKVFFKKGSSDFVCSGTLVNSVNKSLVITAGHCVHGGGIGENWHTNWIFVPAYKNGSAPFGMWSGQVLFAANGWINNADFTYDIGAAVLFPRASDGEMAVDLLGGRGMRWNQTRLQHFWDFGYPASAPFNGQRMILCTASHAFDDDAGEGPDAIGIGCDMTGGSSGGGLVIRIGTRVGGYVNGVNSYKYTSAQPLALYSPYFGNVAKNIFNTAGVWTP